MDREREHHHPSYGMVRIIQQQSSRGQYLFGSSVADHHQLFTLRIHHGMAYEDNVGTGELRFMSAGRVPIVEVQMSAAQFVEMITTHGVGAGVPCTISRIDNQSIELPPRPKTDVERAHGAFEERMQAFGKRLDTFVDDGLVPGGTPQVTRDVHSAEWSKRLAEIVLRRQRAAARKGGS